VAFKIVQRPLGGIQNHSKAIRWHLKYSNTTRWHLGWGGVVVGGGEP
jgi:hypothetical protein